MVVNEPSHVVLGFRSLSWLLVSNLDLWGQFMIINMITVMTIDQQHLQEHYVNALMRGMSWKCWNLLLRHRWNSNMNINTYFGRNPLCFIYFHKCHQHLKHCLKFWGFRVIASVCTWWNTSWMSWHMLSASNHYISALTLTWLSPPQSLLYSTALRACPPNPTVQIKCSNLPPPLWCSLPTFPCKPSSVFNKILIQSNQLLVVSALESRRCHQPSGALTLYVFGLFWNANVILVVVLLKPL